MLKQLISTILKPRFLQRIDRYLLLNRPRLWAMRIHDAYYYGLLADSLIISLIIIFPFQAHHIQHLWKVGIIVLAVDLILLKYVLGKQRYDVAREYGNTIKSKGYLQIMGYMACIIILISPTLIFPWTIRAKLSLSGITQQNLIADIVMLQGVRDVLAFSYLCSLYPEDEFCLKNWEDLKYIKIEALENLKNDSWEALKRYLEFWIAKRQDKSNEKNYCLSISKYIDFSGCNFIENSVKGSYSSEEIKKIIESNDDFFMSLKEGNYKRVFQTIEKYEGISLGNQEDSKQRADRASQHLLSLPIYLSKYETLSDSEKQEKIRRAIAIIVFKGFGFAEVPYYLNLARNYNLIYLPFKFCVLFFASHALVLIYLPLCLFFLEYSDISYSCMMFYFCFLIFWLQTVWFRSYSQSKEEFIDSFAPLYFWISFCSLFTLIIILSWILLEQCLKGESRYSLCQEFLLSTLPLTLVVFIYSSVVHLCSNRFTKVLSLSNKFDVQILLTSFLVIASFLAYFPLINYLTGEFIKLLSLPKEQ
ncbi:MAG: hypothetical protein QNJ47_17990 [Nostocaceae cyanobacterium]|nr:hypothetical protein [Nostocaceae cyanobacterium]